MFCLTIAAGKSQAMITEETTKEETRSTESLSHSDGNNTSKETLKDLDFILSVSILSELRKMLQFLTWTRHITGEMAILRMNSRSNPDALGGNANSFEAANGVAHKRGMVLPFTPLAMSFDSVNYFVDMPAVGINTFYFHSIKCFIHPENTT